MPHGKKKKGGNNNKKNKGGVSVRQKGPSQQSSNSNSNSNSNSSGFQDFNNLPSFHGKFSNSDSRGGGGYYEIYKQSTTRFWDWMKQALPNTKMTAVNDLRKGADHVLNYNVEILDQKRDPPPIVAPTDILKDLEVSIEYREKVSTLQYGGGGGGGEDCGGYAGDEGHKYIVQVLRHCRTALRLGREVARVAAAEMQGQEPAVVANFAAVEDVVGGRFHALALTDEEEAEEERQEREQMEKDIQERNFPTFPDLPSVPEGEMDIEEVLINGGDRFQALSLLNTMDDLMQAVESHYGILKNVMQGDHSMYPGSSIIQLLMECTVVANMATQAIHSAEHALYASHPKLSSFYHVIAVVFLPAYIADVQKLMTQERIQREPDSALEFVAQIVECSFHNRGDTRIGGIAKRFTKRTGIKLQVLELEANKIHFHTSYEMQVSLEEKMNGSLNSMFRGVANLSSHSWLKESPFIGGSRCIFNTHKLVQMVMDLVQDTTKLVGRRGFWGPSLDEDNPTTSMRGGLDDTFGAMILPELIEICRQAPFERLPDYEQLMPVIHLLRRHLKDGDRTRPISIGLSFGLHAVLTSVFVLQGDGDLAKAAVITKGSFENLFRQLDTIADRTRPPENAPAFYSNVQMFKQVINFSCPIKASVAHTGQIPVDPIVSEKLAFWNPVIGGEYMLYATYVCSIGLGSATVDSMGQLRFVMHLYNALRQLDNAFKIPLLTQLDQCFDKTKAVWVGGRPEKGSFCMHFWMAWGFSPSSAANMASKGFADKDFTSHMKKSGREASDSTRDLDEIGPGEFCKSYRRLVLEDLTDDEGVAEYTVLHPPKNPIESRQGLAGLLTRVNMTRDAMDDDEEFVLPTNFPAVGSILLEFVNHLSEALGWDTIMNEAIKTFPEFMRTGKTMGGKQMKPGSFNTSDLNLRGQGLAHLWANLLLQFDGQPAPSTIQKVSNVMKSFFGNVSKSRYQFRLDNDDQIKLIQRRFSNNPLAGSYPYGRTGKTARDPLRAIMHFKYSKAREPVIRILKPGKRTPFVMDSDGDAQSPYDEVGSKMHPEPSGRYRHIASYSMDELIDLGWDGATYTSTRGKHAAVGHHVPFIPGYDSDADDEYEPIDVAAGKRAGVIGIPPEENGLYMLMPAMGGRDNRLVQIKNAR